jgi:hypothetical protein
MIGEAPVAGLGDLGDLIRGYLKSWGAEVVGFGDVREGLSWEIAHLPLAVALAVPHPPLEQCLVERNGVLMYQSHHPEIDALLENIQGKLVRFLRRFGYRYLAIPPDSHRMSRRFIARLYPLFPHKTAATCAGLGWIGRNGLLIHPDYGPRLSWATVLTDAPLEPAKAPVTRSACGSCRRCVGACPAGAISGRMWNRIGKNEPLIDVDACERQQERNFGRTGYYLCGLCVIACSWRFKI